MAAKDPARTTAAIRKPAADLRRHAIPVKCSDNDLAVLKEAVAITGIPRSVLMREGALAEARRAAAAMAASGQAAAVLIEYDWETGGLKARPVANPPPPDIGGGPTKKGQQANDE